MMGNFESIVRMEGVCGGEPIIRNTRIRVAAIVEYYRLFGSTQAITEALPPLTHSDVEAALDYYHTHQDEIEGYLAEDEASESWEVPNQYQPTA